METPEGHYIELRTADVPIGWSNHPDLLRVTAYFTNLRVNEILHPSVHFSRPQPILMDHQSVYIFKEQGRGYHTWDEISGSVAKIKENSWEDIIAKLKEGGLLSLTLSPLSTIDDPSGEPTSYIPYLPNSDFVDRPHLTEDFQIPPQRSVLLYGAEGSGKSELAIQYASKVRTQSPETWVFWLRATTNQIFDEDLEAIADILPKGPPTNLKTSRKDFVLDRLRTQYWEPCLLIVDDVRSDEFHVLSVIDELWLSNRNNRNISFIFTSIGNLQDTRFLLTSSVSRLKVKSLEEDEAFQLLQRKLKRPLADAIGHDLITDINWTPLTVELAAACFNKGLISMSKFVKDIKLNKTTPSFDAYSSLFQSLNLCERSLLYVIGFFHPPEVPKLWLRSYLEWSHDKKGFNELEDSLQSLIESSLLVKISDTSVYKMHTGVRTFVFLLAKLSGKEDKEHKRLQETTRLFIESRNFIPNHRFISDSTHVTERVEKANGLLNKLHNNFLRLTRMTGPGGRNVRISETSIATIEPV